MSQGPALQEDAAGSKFRAGPRSVRDHEFPRTPLEGSIPRKASNAPCRAGRGVFACARFPLADPPPRNIQEVSMFEGQPQLELDALMKANTEFRQLYHRHKELDKQVLDAELGVLPVDDTTLSQMKREKLAAKDRLTRMFDRLHH